MLRRTRLVAAAYAAVAVENQRDEELEVGGVEGGLPQAPAGFLAVVRLVGAPTSWVAHQVDLTGLPGALYAEDPEPEYVDVNRANIAAVTLQENNAVALVHLRTRTVLHSFSAGTVTRDGADLTDDGTVSFTEPLVAPREPDTVQWTRTGNLVTADEGDLAEEPSGGRGWTVFSPSGAVLWTAGGSAERALADERTPELLQVLPTGDAPEGLLALPQRGLFLTSNEDDGTISVFAVTRTR